MTPAKTYLTVWSRGVSDGWVVERSYYETYIRDVLLIPAGGGRVSERDGRYYIALPPGVMPSLMIAHPAAAQDAVDAYTQEPVFPLTRVIA